VLARYRGLQDTQTGTPSVPELFNRRWTSYLDRCS